MKYLVLLLVALGPAVALAASNTKKFAVCTPALNISQFQSRFLSWTLHANSYNGDRVRAAAQNMSDSSLQAAALEVADVGSFLWFDTMSTISTFENYLQKTSCDELFGVVIYDLPGSDCAAKASNGELAVVQLSTCNTRRGHNTG